MAESLKIGAIFAEIRAKQDAFEKDLKGINSKLDETLGKMDKSIQKSANMFTNFAKKAAAAFAAYKLVDFTRGAVMAAARYETLGVVLDRLSKSTRYSAEEIKQLEVALKKTGIAGIESRQVIAQMIQSNLDLSQATKLARVAQDAAVIANLNSSETMQRMMHAIQANSVEILRTIGLNVSFENSVRKAAAAMGKKVEQMTEAEKVQARMNAVIEAGVQIQGAYEAAMSTAAKQMNSFKRYVQDFEVEFGKAFNPGLTKIVFGASEALKTLTEVVKDPAFQSDLTKMSEELANKIVSGMKWLIENRNEIKGYFSTITTGLSDIVSVAQKIPPEVWGLMLGYKVGGKVGAVVGFAGGMYHRLNKEISDTKQELLLQAQTLDQQLKMLRDSGNSASDAYRNVYERLRQVRKEIEALGYHKIQGPEEPRFEYQIEAMRARAYARSKQFEAAAALGVPGKEKDAESIIKKFQEDYRKATLTEFEFERSKIEEQRKEYDKYVKDKVALAKWYQKEMEKIQIKEWESWRSIGESGWYGREEETRFRSAYYTKQTQASALIDEQNRLREIADELANQQRWWDTYVDGVEEATRSTEIFNDTMNILSQSASDAFSAFVMGTKSAKDAFTSMVQSMISAMMRLTTQKTFEMLFGYLMKAGIGLFSGGGSTPTGMGPNTLFAGGKNIGNFLSLVKHHGGMVDGNGPRRSVPSWLFASAPRLHSGLAADEYPAILQKGEEVLSKKEAGRNQPIIHMHFYPNALGQYDRESVSEAQARIYSSLLRANQRNR